MHYQTYQNIKAETTKLAQEIEKKAIADPKKGADQKLINLYFKLDRANQHLDKSEGPPAFQYIEQVKSCGVTWIMDACVKIQTNMISLGLHEYDPSRRQTTRPAPIAAHLNNDI